MQNLLSAKVTPVVRTEDKSFLTKNKKPRFCASHKPGLLGRTILFNSAETVFDTFFNNVHKRELSKRDSTWNFLLRRGNNYYF